ncbi:hypothetical protein AVEN_271940-1 [Araneus ventricosus]|uniref:Uncharacterized protein n=1 Tax=Araneus ventricosus TaxID=182803 RepID=A0A4Y2CBN6_ARAVE|nr:hypothetical protein AVEN_271940-1 [Araneus ventricosus]
MSCRKAAPPSMRAQVDTCRSRRSSSRLYLHNPNGEIRRSRIRKQKASTIRKIHFDPFFPTTKCPLHRQFSRELQVYKMFIKIKCLYKYNYFNISGHCTSPKQQVHSPKVNISSQPEAGNTNFIRLVEQRT